MGDLKNELLEKLQASRRAMVGSLNGLGEYDRRRPMTPSGTNMLGLVKHLIGIEYGYLGAYVGMPAPEQIPWVEDDSVWEGADMWARPEESAEELLQMYRRACAHADQVVRELDLAAPARVPWWPEERRATTLGVLLVRVVDETARHAGHADIVRELLDGRGGPDHDQQGGTAFWSRYVTQVEAAAATFRRSGRADGPGVRFPRPLPNEGGRGAAAPRAGPSCANDDAGGLRWVGGDPGPGG